MKIGDLVYKTESPHGRPGFMGVLIRPMVGGAPPALWEVVTMDGKIVQCYDTTLEVISESR
jgi:hypothetical protein